MVEPLQTSGHVAPADIHHLVDGRLVIAGKEGQEQLVAVVECPVQLGVDVIEIEGVVLEIVRQLQEHIHISTPSSNQKRQFILDDRPFERAFCREQSDGCPAVPA